MLYIKCKKTLNIYYFFKPEIKINTVVFRMQLIQISLL